MLSKCANPECGTAFDDYRQGKLFRFSIRDSNVGTVHKHFWLCPRCSSLYSLQYRVEDGVLLISSSGFVTKPRFFNTSADAAEVIKGRSAKRIFQIAYDEQLRLERTAVLRELGYAIVSVIGNETAQVLLGSSQHYDLFIVGYRAPAQIRSEMVEWLRTKYPNVKILALSRDPQEVIATDCEVVVAQPEEWLRVVTRIM
jgi:hypothetical protein